MSNQVTCPVSGDRINENAARIAAGYTVAITLFSVLSGYHWIMILLSADFALRAFTPGKWSPMRWLAGSTVRLFRINPKPVDAAPKKFAAGLGMGFSALIFTAGILNYPVTEVILASMLIGCAILESAFAYCVGCIIYTILMQFISSKKSLIRLPDNKT